jgi:hypothetical protein
MNSRLIALLLLSLCGGWSLYGEMPRVLERTISPNKRYVIRCFGDLNYAFFDNQTGKPIGEIKEVDDRSNIYFVATWNKDSSKAAVLMYYGTRGTMLLIFQRNRDGIFTEMPFKEPRVIGFYKKKYKKEPFPEESSLVPEPALGPWDGENKVLLVEAEENILEDANPRSLILCFNAEARKGSIVLSGYRMKVFADEKASEKFLKSIKVIH